MRRVSAIRRVLNLQARENDTEAEVEWYGERLRRMPDINIASVEQEKHFSVEQVYYKEPMGYHLPEGIGHLPPKVWKNKDNRKSILKYCPDIAIILPMKLERERCEGDDREGNIKG